MVNQRSGSASTHEVAACTCRQCTYTSCRCDMTMPPTCSSGIQLKEISSGPNALLCAVDAERLRILRCDSCTPLGCPVLPDVNRSNATSSGSGSW
ncbi:Uncharacterised protein [Mycobacteroides abscessus subsp. abscessus]|nr:Uncharacterised protein [Mycobacteroides abscessus subsp. abscessus]SKV26017.1 Uncharacterised protein [Mycobacteroides abscessus subsp. abscessus]